jgi:hypothetical protein
MDAFSATRWISAIARHDGLLLGGENPGYGLPASLNSFYVNTSSTGMMAAALRQATSCGFSVFYWAHDVHLWDGTISFSLYATSTGGTAPAVNLATTATITASTTTSGFAAASANDNNQNTYWQATAASATLTLKLAAPATVGRIVLELPAGWGTRTQTVQVDGSANGTAWTTLAASAAYQFTAGNGTVTITIPARSQGYLRLDLSGNTAQGAPQIAELQAYTS